MSAKALFIDLDGTLIETKSGSTFPKDKDDWKFKRGILSRVKWLYDQGYKPIIISNQAGIDEGHITPLEFTSKVCLIDEQLSNFLKKSEYKYNSWEPGPGIYTYWMVADSLVHNWRKPNPDAAYFAADKFNLDLSKSIMVGDASGIWRRKVGVPDYIVEEFENYVDKGLDIKVIDTNDGTRYEKAVDGAITTYYTARKDFSDSDKQFAQNAGIGTYYDVEEFVTKL